jgi:hypothetical protein
MATAVQERARVAINKAEDTIRELEQTVQAMPERTSSPWLLGAALGSIALAITLYARKRKDDAMFVGLWAPTFLALELFGDWLKIRSRASPSGDASHNAR